MWHLPWLDQEYLNRIRHIFPKLRGVERVDDHRAPNGIIHVIRKGPRCPGALFKYGSHTTH